MDVYVFFCAGIGVALFATCVGVYRCVQVCVVSLYVWVYGCVCRFLCLCRFLWWCRCGCV